MAHLAMFSIPAPGHVNPSLEVVRLLVERGHRVSYVNDPRLQGPIEDAGATLVPYRSVLPAVNLGGDTPGDTPGDTFEGDAVDHLARFQDEYEAMLPAARDAFAADVPDLVLYDIAGTPGRLLARRWGVPAVQLSPTYVAWEGYEDDMAEFHEGLRRDPRGAAYLARQRAMLAEFGVEGDPLHYLGRPARSIVLVAEALQPNADRVDRSTYTFVGPAVRRPDPTSSWRAPLDPARRVVLVSLGTAFTRRPDLYRACLAVFGDSPSWHLVLQIGSHVGLDEILDGPVPANVEIATWVPQREILEDADLFITHAGMGGSSEGLVTGTPMIAVPQDVDQFDNADALVAAGVAVRLATDGGIGADALAEAVLRAGEEQVRRRSREVAEELAAAGGAEEAVRIVEEVLRAGR